MAEQDSQKPSPTDPLKAREKKAPAPTPPAPSEEPVMLEDSTSRALSEALRSSFKIIKFLMVVLVVVFVFSGFFTVEQNQVAVVLRFGKPRGDTIQEQVLGPGFHWALPYPIDEIVTIPVGQTHTIQSSIGWYATTDELEAKGLQPPARSSMIPGVDGYAITGDGNIIHVRSALHYRITEQGALDYKFKFSEGERGVTNLLQNILNNSILYAAARFTAEDALYNNPNAFRSVIQERAARLIERENFGITLDPIDVETSAPLDVQQAFEDVQKAEQQWSTAVNDAEAEAQKIVINAQSEASRIISEGLTRSNHIVTSVAADAANFEEQLPYYNQDPELFKERILTETLERVLTNAQDKFFVPSREDGQTREVRLLYNREPRRSSGNTNETTRTNQ